MEEFELFSAALGLKLPWFVDSVKLDASKEELHITVGHLRRVQFEYEGSLLPVYDHQERIWQHLNFFQHRCFIHAKVPRVKTAEGKVKLVSVPWALPGSSFTLLFEHSLLKLVELGMNVSKAAEYSGIKAKRVYNLIHKRVANALASQSLDKVRELSIDETSSKKGHNYLTILADREAKKVVGISQGKDTSAVLQAILDMEIRGALRSHVKCVSMDMSKSYISAANQYLNQADIVFDRFHITKKLNEQLDTLRRIEQSKFSNLKNSRYLWLRNQKQLRTSQQERLIELQQAYPTLGEAHRLKELFKSVMDNAIHNRKLRPLNDWIKIAWNSQIKQIQEFVNFLHSHWYGIKTYFKKLVTNAFAERVNLKIQEIKRAAKGYRNMHNFISIIYFHLGGLNLYKPTL